MPFTPTDLIELRNIIREEQGVRAVILSGQLDAEIDRLEALFAEIKASQASAEEVKLLREFPEKLALFEAEKAKFNADVAALAVNEQRLEERTVELENAQITLASDRGRLNTDLQAFLDRQTAVELENARVRISLQASMDKELDRAKKYEEALSALMLRENELKAKEAELKKREEALTAKVDKDAKP